MKVKGTVYNSSDVIVTNVDRTKATISIEELLDQMYQDDGYERMFETTYPRFWKILDVVKQDHEKIKKGKHFYFTPDEAILVKGLVIESYQGFFKTYFDSRKMKAMSLDETVAESDAFIKRMDERIAQMESSAMKDLCRKSIRRLAARELEYAAREFDMKLKALMNYLVSVEAGQGVMSQYFYDIQDFLDEKLEEAMKEYPSK